MTVTWNIHSCAEVTEEDIDVALEEALSPADRSPQDKVTALLEKMGEVAKPGDGASRILLVLARLASSPWVAGVVEIRVRPEGSGVKIEVLADDGLSQRKLHRGLRANAPFEEFDAAVALNPKRFAPLQLKPAVEGGILRLLAKAGMGSEGRLPRSRRMPAAPANQKTVRREVAVPKDARRGTSEVPPPPPTVAVNDDPNGIDVDDEGWG